MHRGVVMRTVINGITFDGATKDAMQCAVRDVLTTIGLDIAKNVFQVHGIDAAEKVVVRKQLRRSQVLKWRERYCRHCHRPEGVPVGA
jgi:hypothetical protein